MIKMIRNKFSKALLAALSVYIGSIAYRNRCHAGKIEIVPWCDETPIGSQVIIDDDSHSSESPPTPEPNTLIRDTNGWSVIGIPSSTPISVLLNITINGYTGNANLHLSVNYLQEYSTSRVITMESETIMGERKTRDIRYDIAHGTNINGKLYAIYHFTNTISGYANHQVVATVKVNIGPADTNVYIIGITKDTNGTVNLQTKGQAGTWVRHNVAYLDDLTNDWTNSIVVTNNEVHIPVTDETLANGQSIVISNVPVASLKRLYRLLSRKQGVPEGGYTTNLEQEVTQPFYKKLDRYGPRKNQLYKQKALVR